MVKLLDNTRRLCIIGKRLIASSPSPFLAYPTIMDVHITVFLLVPLNTFEESEIFPHLVYIYTPKKSQQKHHLGISSSLYPCICLSNFNAFSSPNAFEAPDVVKFVVQETTCCSTIRSNTPNALFKSPH